MSTIYQPLDSGFMPLTIENKVYIKIDKISYGDFKIDKNDTIIVCIGARSNFNNEAYQFKASIMSPKKIWSFNYKNANKSSFVVVLFKHRFLGSDVEIGEIELKISGFANNAVTTHEFTLKCPWGGVPAKVTLSVHVCENGSYRFTAPLKSGINTEAIMQHKGFYASK